MPEALFQNLFALAGVPSGWKLVRLTLDWDGRPLLLFSEGKPLETDPRIDMEACASWYRITPKRHHVVHRTDSKLQALAFKQSQGLSTFTYSRLKADGSSENVEERPHLMTRTVQCARRLVWEMAAKICRPPQTNAFG